MYQKGWYLLRFQNKRIIWPNPSKVVGSQERQTNDCWLNSEHGNQNLEDAMILHGNGYMCRARQGAPISKLGMRQKYHLSLLRHCMATWFMAEPKRILFQLESQCQIKENYCLTAKLSVSQEARAEQWPRTSQDT